jgi:hypothetical protein
VCGWLCANGMCWRLLRERHVLLDFFANGTSSCGFSLR